MVKLPVQTKRMSYRGSDVKKRAKASAFNQMSAAIEAHVNKALEEQRDPIHSYMYYVIARETGFTEGQVRDACMQIDGGSGGFTAIRSDLSFEEAMRLTTNAS